MKITIVSDRIDDSVSYDALVRSLNERGHEIVTVCFDESFENKKGFIVIPRIRPVGSEALENAIWDSDAVYIASPTKLGLAALRLCSGHCIPSLALASTAATELEFRKYMRYNPHCEKMRLRHIYYGYLQKADAVIYRSGSDKRAFEFSADCEDNGFVLPNLTDEGALDRFEEILESIHV